MFDRCDDAFIYQLVRVLRPQVLLKGDFAFKLNDPGDCMYFLKKGAVQISNQNRSMIYCTLMPGSHFGELAMLTAQRRTATATAVTDCIMFYMTSQDFDDVMSDFPGNYNEILDRALERLDTVLRSNASLEVTQPLLPVPRRHGQPLRPSITGAHVTRLHQEEAPGAAGGADVHQAARAFGKLHHRIHPQCYHHGVHPQRHNHRVSLQPRPATRCHSGRAICQQ